MSCKDCQNVFRTEIITHFSYSPKVYYSGIDAECREVVHQVQECAEFRANPEENKFFSNKKNRNAFETFRLAL